MLYSSFINLTILVRFRKLHGNLAPVCIALKIAIFAFRSGASLSLQSNKKAPGKYFKGVRRPSRSHFWAFNLDPG